MSGLQPRPSESRYARTARPLTRQIERAQIHTPVTVTFHGQGFRGWLNDVSEGGVGLISVAALQRNDEISVTLLLSGQSQPLTLRAVVRHTCGFHHGCQFLETPPGEHTRLKQYLIDASRITTID